MVHLVVGAEVGRVAAIELAAVERRLRRITEGGVVVVAGGVELDAARPNQVLDLLAVASGDGRGPDVVGRAVVAQEAVEFFHCEVVRRLEAGHLPNGLWPLRKPGTKTKLST